MIEELLFLKGSVSEVGNPGILRGILKDYFGYFREMRQQDAGDALLAILEHIPGMEGTFYVRGKVTRECIECGDKKERVEEEGVINCCPLNYSEGVVELQDAVNSFENRSDEVSLKCVCTSKIVLEDGEEKVLMRDTNHMVSWEIIECPEVY